MTFDLFGVLLILTVALFTPGPDFLVVVKNSLGGRARGLATVAGIAAGLAVQTTLLSAAFGTLSAYAGPAAAVLRWAGAVVLVGLGVRSLREGGRGQARHAPAPGEAAAASAAAAAAPDRAGGAVATRGTKVGAFGAGRAGWLEGFACNLTNPKAFVFFAGLFSQLLGPGAPGWLHVALPVIVVVHALVCWSLLAVVVQSPPVARRLARWRVTLVRAFGVLLILFGLGLVVWRDP
jgi:threonine/homoserine/homoserine lactone efflux protein